MSVAATIERLQEERQAQVDFIEQLTESAAVETRDLVDAELQNIATAETRCAELDAQLRPLVEFQTRRESAVQVGALTRTPARSGSGIVVETRSIGEIYTESPEFLEYGGKGTSAVTAIPQYRAIPQVRAVGPDPLLTTTEPGATLMPTPSTIYRDPRVALMPLLALVEQIEITGDSVRVVTTTDPTGADVVPEGQPKPPVEWTASDVVYTAEMVAGWYKFSRQALRNIPGIRDKINQKIRRSIDRRLNALAGAAVQGAITGANTTAAALPLEEVVRLALAELEERGVIPNAALVSPRTAATIDLSMLNRPANGTLSATDLLWRVPKISVPGLADDQVILGDFADNLNWYGQLGLNMYTTDSDVSDIVGGGVRSDFRTNILTTLGEVYGAMVLEDASWLQAAVSTSGAAEPAAAAAPAKAKSSS